MRHGKAWKKLERSPSHRRALLRNLATSLIQHERIETTITKAKALRRVADRLITLGKKGTLPARRQAIAYLMPVNREVSFDTKKRTVVHKLFEDLAPRYNERSGGYTRVIRTRKREGDKAQLAMIEFVESSSAVVSEKKEKKKRRVVRTGRAKKEAASHETA